MTLPTTTGDAATPYDGSGPTPANQQPGVYPLSEHFVEVQTRDHSYKIPRACPHAGASLDLHGRLDVDALVLTCLHKRYAWQVTTGAHIGSAECADIQITAVSRSAR